MPRPIPALAAVAVFGLAAFALFVVKPALECKNASGVTLTDIHSVEDLRARFNQDAGVPRLILLLSPT